MRNLILVATVLAGLFWCQPTGAQMHHGPQESMPMHTEMMHHHMSGMADLMSDMAGVMRKGDLTPEQQADCAEFMDRMSNLMSEYASDPEGTTSSPRWSEMEEIEREWDYWTREQNLYAH